MEIKVPDLGVDSAEVSEIMVKVGDTIAVNDNLVLLESDKASVEVPATTAGKITAIRLNIGDKVKEGDVILEVASEGETASAPTPAPVQTESAPASQPQTEAQPTAQPAPVQTAQASSSRFPLPDLGVDTAEVAEIMVKVGDTVEKEQPLVLVESDKASVEVPAPVSGKVVEILINAGDKVANGQDFIVIESSEGGIVPTQAPTQTPAQTQSQPQPTTPVAQSTSTASDETTYPLPDLGVDSAEVAEVMVKVGDTVTADQPTVLVESDKASVEVPAPVAGTVVKILVNAGEKVKNGQDFIVIKPEGAGDVAQASAPVQAPSTPAQTQTQATPAPVASPAQAPAQTATQSSAQLNEQQVNAKLGDVYAGPAVRKLSRQLGVDVTQVKGSGNKGRVSKEDIFAYVKQRMQAPAPSVSQGATSGAVRSGLPNLPDMSKVEIWGEIERQDLSKLQKVSIPQLNYNTYIPQVTQFDLADITDTEQMRSDIKEEMKKQGVSLTILAFIMKAVAYALGEHPKFNSHLSDDNTQILIRKSVHMGFAVATPTGLTVPVIKDVQTKGIKQIAQEIGEMAVKARDNKLTPKDMTGASFTISSQGNLGGTYFTPLVTWPQVAILGVSEASMQPRWNGKEFEPRLMLPLSLSYDHRVINGADAAVFTRYVAKLLADPRRILL